MAMNHPVPDYEITQTLGVTGLNRSNGYIHEEYHRNLTGKKAVKIYREMSDSSPIIGRWLLEQRLLIGSAVGGPEPVDDSQQARMIANHCRECIEDMEGPLRTVVGDMLSSAVYGYALLEKVYKIRGGEDAPLERMRSRFNDRRIGIYDLSPRSQDTIDRWEFDSSGRPIGAWQSAPPSYYTSLLPIDKLIHIKAGEQKRSPEGRSPLRNAYRPWWLWMTIEDLEAIGVEKDMAGMFVISVPPEYLSDSATAEQKATVRVFRDVVAQVRRGEHEGLVMPAKTDRNGNPTGFDHGLVQSGGRRPVDQHEIIKRLESRMAIALMADSSLVGMNGVGALSLQDAKDNLQSLMRKGLMGLMTDALNGVYREVTKLNGWPAELAPVHEFGEIESKPTGEELGGIASLLGAGGLTPGDQLEKYIRARLKIDDEVEPSIGQMQDALGAMNEADALGLDDMAAQRVLTEVQPITGENTIQGAA